MIGRYKRLRHFTSTAALATVLLCSSCNSESDTRRFTDTYTQILLVREQFIDTATANPRVDSILHAHGYTRDSFKAQFQELSRQPDALRRTMDSVRTLVQKNAKH